MAVGTCAQAEQLAFYKLARLQRLKRSCKVYGVNRDVAGSVMCSCGAPAAGLPYGCSAVFNCVTSGGLHVACNAA